MFGGLRSAWRRVVEREAPVEREELELKAARVKLLQSLLASPGWGIYAGLLRSRHEALLRELENAPVERLVGLQSATRELRMALELAPALLKDGERAEMELRAMEARG